MSRAYVQQRLRQIAAQREAEASSIKVDGRTILWSLTAGCWMLCDFARGTCERLTEIPASPEPQSGDSNG